MNIPEGMSYKGSKAFFHTEKIVDYFELVKFQNNKCAICGKEPNYMLLIDHDHKTGLVRGLLCAICNRDLGIYEWNLETVKKYPELCKGYENDKEMDNYLLETPVKKLRKNKYKEENPFKLLTTFIKDFLKEEGVNKSNFAKLGIYIESSYSKEHSGVYFNTDEQGRMSFAPNYILLNRNIVVTVAIKDNRKIDGD